MGVMQITHTLELKDVDRTQEPWAFGPKVNVIGATCQLAQPVPCKGNLSHWALDDDVRTAVCGQLRTQATVNRNDVSHLPSRYVTAHTPQRTLHTVLHTPHRTAHRLPHTAQGYWGQMVWNQGTQSIRPARRCMAQP